MNLFAIIKEKVQILDIVGQYTTLKKAGLYWKGHCPFHAEKTPSFTVSPHKEIFYCFGCQSGGDVITFIEKAENFTALQAAEFLATRYNIAIPQQELAAFSDKSDEKKRYYQLCGLIASWCHTQLLSDNHALGYLQQRNISLAMIQRFTIGYFPAGSKRINQLLNVVKKEQFLAKDLIDAHVLAESKAYLYSPFEERIIFPITDHLGRCTGFGARIFKAEDQRAKYYNSRETSYFDKGSLLFGLDQAKKDIQQSNTVFMVEGYMDCIAMVQAGFANTIATLGTACTLEHLKQLARYAEALYVVYDGDTAGKNAILRIAQMCWQTDLELKIITLPEGYDPASYLSKGGDLPGLIEKAKDIFMYFIDSLGSNFNQKSLKQKMQILQRLLDVIITIQDPLKQDLLLQTAAQQLGIPFDMLKNQCSKATKPVVPPLQTAASEQDNPHSSKLKQITILEKKLFSVIINNMESERKKIDIKKDIAIFIDYFSEPLKMVLQKAQALSENGPLPFAVLFQALNNEQQRLVSSILIEFAAYQTPEELNTLVNKFQHYHWKSMVHIIKRKIAQAEQENNTDEVRKLIIEFQELKKILLRLDLKGSHEKNQS